VYTNNIPSGAFRGYGLGQVIFAVESALDQLADELGVDPVDLRRRNVVVPGDPFVDAHVADDDLTYGSYGLDQCLDLVQHALASGEGLAAPDGEQWRVGEGVAVAMIATIPPRGHFADASISLDADGDFTLSVGTAEFGNGTSTVHGQIVASELGVDVGRIRLRQSDTDATSYDTGAFGSAGTVVAGLAVQAACRDLRAALEASPDVRPLTGYGRHDGTPRSVAFNVQGFRVAVDVTTGEVRILQSVHAADAGVVMNPEQCRGQVEGGVGQGIGSALYEEMRTGPDGAVTTVDLRGYHIPQLADLPVTEVYFADTYDELGPFGAKSMSESPYNPVAPALANAIARACGARLHRLPMTPARVWRALNT
jgi:CO/xanthine dehydrogenase Mo-binding subunit